jgi:hypothetical protein
MIFLARLDFKWAAGPMQDVKALIEEVQGILQTKPEKSKRLNLLRRLRTATWIFGK